MQLTTTQKECVCFAINYFGSGQHPMAEPKNLGGFNYEYARQCVEKAVASKQLSDKGLAIAREVLATHNW
jgi:hypothetical protein